MKKRWLYYITPFTLTALACAFIVYAGYRGDQEGDWWSGVGMVIYGCVLFMLLIADYLIKQVTKDNVLRLWVLELIGLASLIGMFVYCFH